MNFEEGYPSIPIPEKYLDVQVIGVESILNLVKPFLDKKKNEYLISIALKSNRKPISIRIVSIGSKNQCSMSLPDFVRSAVVDSASGIILVHNHPDGSANHSHIDLESMEKIEDALDTVAIKLVDSIVIEGNNFQSLSTKYKEEKNQESYKTIKKPIVLLSSIEDIGKSMQPLGLVIVSIVVFCLFIDVSKGTSNVSEISNNVGLMILIYPIFWAVEKSSKFVKTLYGED